MFGCVHLINAKYQTLKWDNFSGKDLHTSVHLSAGIFVSVNHIKSPAVQINTDKHIQS